MAMNRFVDLSALEPFDPAGDASNVSQRWKQWRKRFEYYVGASGVTDKAQKKSIVLHMIGPQGQDIYETLTDNGDDCKSVLDVLGAYFEPQRNIPFERHLFFICKQSEGDSVDQFVTKLKRLATTCEFGAEQDNMVRDQVVQGCVSNTLRRRFLRESNLTLAKILEVARPIELAASQADKMEKKEKADVLGVGSRNVSGYKQTGTKGKHKGDSNKFRQNKSHYDRKEGGESSHGRHDRLQEERKCFRCFRCNKTGHGAKSDKCPARNKTCSICSKKGHFAVTCWKNVDKPCQNQRGKVNVLVDKKPENLFSDSSNEEDVFMVEVRDEEEVEAVLGIDSTEKSREKVDIKVNDVDIPFTIDSGAGVNIIDKNSFQRISHSKPVRLLKADKQLYTYGSKVPLELEGKINCNIKYLEKAIEGDLYVASSRDSGCLLGKRTAESLDVLKVGRVNLVSQKGIWQKDKLIEKYPTVFEGVGKLKDVKVHIHVDEQVKPVVQPYRRVPYHLTQKVVDKIKEFENLDLIEDVGSIPTTWVSQMVVVPKPDGDIRICIDMRLANKAICREIHPIPTFEEISQDMHGSCVFSKLDLKMGYHQLELDENSRDITTFATPTGLKRFKRLIMGVSSASEIYQNTLELKVFYGLGNVKVISDDVIIYGKTQEEHDTALIKVMDRLQEKGLTVNKRKCQFNVDEIKFFGVILSKSGIKTDPEKVKAVQNLTKSKNIAELRSLLGLTTYFSRFIKDYATIVEPLRELLRVKKGNLFNWTKRQQEALDKIKVSLATSSVMAYWTPGAEIRLTTDASPFGLGAILEQKQSDGRFKPLAFASRSLSDVERRYSQTEKEGLGIVWGCEKFQLYLVGTNFVLLTDHKPLERIFDPRHKTSARLERWALRLQPFIFTIKYIKGKDNPTDILSRMPMQNLINQTRIKTEEYINEIINYALPVAIQLEEIQECMKTDMVLQKVVAAVKSDVWKNEECLKSYKQVRNELTLAQGLLLRQSRIVMPKELQKRTIDLVHKNHMGIVKSKEHLRSKVWWPSMDSEVEQQIKRCRPCQLVGRDGKPEPLIICDLPDRPWQVVYADICGPFPGGESIFALIDGYSRFPEAIIIRSTKSDNLIRHMETMFSRLGFPERLVTDNGSNFVSYEMKCFLRRCGIKHRKVVPYSPQSNGMIERFNRTIKKAVQTSHADNFSWQRRLNSFLMDYRSTPHTSTNKSPAFLMFNREIRTDIPSFNNTVLADKEVRETDRKSKEKIKVYHDKSKKVQESQLKVGDFVLLRQEKQNKLTTRFENMKYKVVEKKGNAVTLCDSAGKMKMRNTREVKKYIQDEEEKENGSLDGFEDDINMSGSDDTDRNVVVLSGGNEMNNSAEVQVEDNANEGGPQLRRSSRGKARPKYLDQYICNVNHHLSELPSF